MKLLVLNPNTSARVTALLQAAVQSEVGPAVQVAATTATLGASYIASEASYAIAAHGALDAWARFVEAEGVPDAVLLGCFGDPGVQALRELSGRPVLGLAEAAMRQAAERGRFAIVTGGAAWVPMLERLARGLGLADALIGVHAVAPSGAELLADRDRALGLLAEACRAAVAAGRGRGGVILGGAALAGMADEVSARAGVPVIDSVRAGAEMLLRDLAATTPPPSLSPSWSPPRAPSPSPAAGGGAGAAAWQGLSPALARQLSG